MMRLVLSIVLAVGLLAACPASKEGAPPATCAKVGDACTFAPGKLGLCIEPAGGGTPICQSQH